MQHQQTKSSHNLTEENCKRGDEKSASIARKQESDAVTENKALGNVSSPEDDAAGENKVATSLDNE